MISTRKYGRPAPVSQDGDAASAVAAAERTYVTELSTALVALGHSVEIWTLQFDSEPHMEVAERGLPVRRFRGGEIGYIPKRRPCAWIPRWVTNAGTYLALARRANITLVTHDWEAGIAGKLLASEFGLPLIYVPHSLGQSTLESGRVREEREVLGAASTVVATTPGQRDLLVGNAYGVPAQRVAIIPSPFGGGADGLTWTDVAFRFVEVAQPRSGSATLCHAAVGPALAGDLSEGGGAGYVEAGLANCPVTVNDSIL